jgi:hypothetical protein
VSAEPLPTYRKRCARCERRQPADQVRQVGRHGGGNWRRAGRAYRTNCCLDCARELLTHVTQGHHSVDRWDVTGLVHLVRDVTGEDVPHPGLRR